MNMKVLFYISTVFVSLGMVLGLHVIRPIESINGSMYDKNTLIKSSLTTSIIGLDSVISVKPQTTEPYNHGNDNDKWGYVMTTIDQVQRTFQSKFISTLLLWWIVGMY